MKMFLTRLGFGSKIVITGDITQIDLPADKVSGLREAMRVLKGVEDIEICRLCVNPFSLRSAFSLSLKIIFCYLCFVNS